jgi:hypothetical protein
MKRNEPYPLATWLFSLLLRQRDKETLLGDLIEEHASLASVLGRRQASEWFWSQMARSVPSVLWANIRRGVWIKALGAVLVGYLAVAMLVIVGDIVMSKLLPANELVYSLVSLAAAIPAMMLGGYLAAWIRPRAAIGLAIFSTVMAIVSIVVTGDRAPLWYQAALTIIGPLAALAGGRFRIRRAEDVK